MENIFNVKYNTKMDRLEIKKEKNCNKIYKFIQKHKFISIIFVSFLTLASINFYLVYSFMRILENI